MGSTRKLKGWDGRTGSDLIAECASDEWRIYEREYGGVRWCEIKEPKRLCHLVAGLLMPRPAAMQRE